MSSDTVAQDQLQSFVRRIESVEDEINALNSDKSEIYKEAKGAGFDVKVMRKLIADRRKDASERAEFETIYDLYAAALGMRLYRHEGDQPSSVRAHVENIEEFPVEHDADGVFQDDETTHVPTDGGSNESASEPAVEPFVGAIENNDLNGHSAGGQTNEAVTTSAQIVAGEGAHNASVTPFTPKPLRPYCLNTDKCGGQGRKHCWSCQKAHDEQQGVA